MAGFTGTSDSPHLAYLKKFAFPHIDPDDPEALARTLAPCVKEARARGSSATTLLYHPEVYFFLTEAPEVPREELGSALRWQSNSLFGLSPEAAVVDALPATLAGPQGAYAFVAGASQEKVRNRVRALKEGGLDGRYVDVPELAMRNLSLLLPGSAAGTCILALDDRNCLITITKGEELGFTRDLGIRFGEEVGKAAETYGLGQKEIWRHLSERGLLLETATGLTEEAPTGLESSPLTELTDHLALEIQRSLDYYSFRFQQPAVEKVYLLGRGANIQGLESYLETTLGLEFEFFDPLDYIAAEPGIAQSRQDPESPLHEGALAIGAGLRMMAPGQV